MIGALTLVARGSKSLFSGCLTCPKANLGFLTIDVGRNQVMYHVLAKLCQDLPTTKSISSCTMTLLETVVLSRFLQQFVYYLGSHEPGDEMLRPRRQGRSRSSPSQKKSVLATFKLFAFALETTTIEQLN